MFKIGDRVWVKALKADGNGVIYASALSGTNNEIIYGIRLDKIFRPKYFIATRVWHCYEAELESLAHDVKPLMGQCCQDIPPEFGEYDEDSQLGQKEN